MEPSCITTGSVRSGLARGQKRVRRLSPVLMRDGRSKPRNLTLAASPPCRNAYDSGPRFSYQKSVLQVASLYLILCLRCAVYCASEQSLRVAQCRYSPYLLDRLSDTPPLIQGKEPYRHQITHL